MGVTLGPWGSRKRLLRLALIAVVFAVISVVLTSVLVVVIGNTRQEENSSITDVDDDENVTFAPGPAPPPPSSSPPPYTAPPGFSERITIPQPRTPKVLALPLGKNCPHYGIGLMDWHDDDLSLTPTEDGDDVTIPENTRVVVRRSVTKPIGTLTIPNTSELILAEDEESEEGGGIEMTLGGMVVRGKLTAGSETCGIETPIVLTFTGTRPSDAVQNPPSPAVKGIDVEGGVLSLHGKRYFRTWTRLSQTVQAGDTVLKLQHAVNWQVGQEIVLVTTAMKDARDWHQNEVLTIAEITPTTMESGATAVRVSTPVRHRHVAIANYQAEVGLLTRTIRIQGAANDSEPTDPDLGGCAAPDRESAQYGDPSQPCTDKELTGYGAHVIVRNQGKGYVEGVEFFRVGQTNVMARYPMHFHLLGDCEDCYLRASSIHRSYYRCVSVHATNKATVTENVAYDVSGFCYYLEDGVETENTLSFNLAAHIHMIGPDIPYDSGQRTPIYKKSDTLNLPADVSAGGFYISNVHNYVIGNAASGGWAAFAFPNLPTPVGLSRDVDIRPSSALPLTIDGNSAHSSGFWWDRTGGFYFGGSLWYDYDDDVLTYNPGRSFYFEEHNRNTCAKPDKYCNPKDRLWLRLTNTKSYLNAGVGLSSWTGRMELVGFESHDNGLSVEALSDGFWIDDMLAVCRSGEPIALPPDASITEVKGDGFQWYDTGQSHIITDSIFRNCGVNSPEFDQYDTSPNRGCAADDLDAGCHSSSFVWGFLTHSDTFVPEIMQGTRGIVMQNVGRRFALNNFRGGPSTASGRTQNWLDADGSVSGLGTPTLIGSGLVDARAWWTVDNRVVPDPQGPLVFIPQHDGPERNLGHLRMEWDASLHKKVGGSLCGNGDGAPCPAVGLLRHRGPKFTGAGLPITASADVVGPTGGHGWYLELQQGAPVGLNMTYVEVDPSTPLMFSIAYPPGTNVTVRVLAGWCTPKEERSCEEVFTAVESDTAVRQGEGNVYHYSEDTGLLTIRIIMTAKTYTGRPDWELAQWDTAGRPEKGTAVDRFERDGVLLPEAVKGPVLELKADCTSTDGVYCDQGIDTAAVQAQVDAACPEVGMEQVSYDMCCSSIRCVYANGDEDILM